MSSQPSSRRILTAELLSIGSELTVGETRDTNAAELARSLTDAGVAVGRITALPDRLETVADAFATALARVDLVVSTGGLGPTPDDLTREAIAGVWGETPVVDPDLERWLRDLWARRDIPFPEANIKQAWRIPSGESLPNPNGTAPGWFVSNADGRVAIALPGPPREMRPMWADHALPRLRTRGLGADVAVRTYRLMGIGESQVAEILGESMLREARIRRSRPTLGRRRSTSVSAHRPRSIPRVSPGRRRRWSRMPPRRSASVSRHTSGPKATRPGRARSGHVLAQRGGGSGWSSSAPVGK